jgi:hypothetical protein
LETTAALILGLFPPAHRNNASVVELAERVDAFTRAAYVPHKIDCFIDFFSWLRMPDQKIHELAAPGVESKEWHSAVWKRERVWVSVLEASDEVRDRYREAIGTLLKETGGTSLFAQSGMPNDRGLFS